MSRYSSQRKQVELVDDRGGLRFLRGGGFEGGEAGGVGSVGDVAEGGVGAEDRRGYMGPPYVIGGASPRTSCSAALISALISASLRSFSASRAG